MRINIKGLRATGFHGVREFERRDGQEFVVDVTLKRPTPWADALPATVNYSEIADTVIDVIQGPPFDLIETLGQEIAGRLLRERPSVHMVKVAVHKPNAPLKVEFGDVVCRVKRRRRDCPATGFVLSLGSNLVDPDKHRDLDENLRLALHALAATPGIDLTACSSVYRTTPVEVGSERQPDFHNLVVMGLTTLEPHELLRQTASVEQRLGRTRPYPHAPRVIDIDIVKFGDAVIHDDELTIPHPRASQRGFVLTPWIEIAPHAKLPEGSLTELVPKLGPETVEKIAPIW